MSKIIQHVYIYRHIEIPSNLMELNRESKGNLINLGWIKTSSKFSPQLLPYSPPPIEDPIQKDTQEEEEEEEENFAENEEKRDFTIAGYQFQWAGKL